MSDSTAIFMVGQSNGEAQVESRANAKDGDTSLKNIKDPSQVNASQLDTLTFEKNIVSKVGSEVDSVMTTVETGRSVDCNRSTGRGDDCNRKLGTF